MFQFLSEHQFGTAAALYWLYSAAVSSMPDPAPSGAPGYLWLYRFCHTIAGNLTTAFGSRMAGLKSLALLSMVFLFLTTSACAAHYAIHPGALNATDSAAYDALLVASSAIDQARTDAGTHQLPDSARNPLNALINSYNIARDSWLTYRGAIATKVPSASYFDQLNTNLTDLTTAIRAFTEAK